MFELAIFLKIKKIYFSFSEIKKIYSSDIGTINL